MGWLKRTLLIFVGSGLLIFFVYIFESEREFSAGKLGVLTLALGALLIAMFDPSEIAFSGLSMKFKKIEHDLTDLRKKLRPLAVFDCVTRRVIYSTFPSGEIEFVMLRDLNARVEWASGSDLGVRISLKGQKPKFVEARTNGSFIAFKEPKHVGGIWIYDGKYEMVSTDDITGEVVDQVVFEAYF